jgi:steroid 5-alpha reductase family enzyme
MMTLYTILLITEFALALPIFILLFFISAPYGKFLKKEWGPAANASLAWCLMELPVVIIPMFFFITSKRTDELIYLVFIIIWELHYIQRTFIYPFILNKNSHNVPLLIILFSAVFNLINGYIIGIGTFILPAPVSHSLLSFRFILGFSIFLTGFIINISSDRILRNLRSPGETDYKIPQKGLFKYICNPNYFGEILEWTGWAILTWSPAGAAFLIFTIANLVPRATANLKWYQKTFPNYPRKRKAILPLIF